MLGPSVAELGIRAKCDILRARAKHITEPDWSKGIRSWVDAADTVNTHRNKVAHHRVKTIDGKLTLYAEQARRLLGSIKNGKPVSRKPSTISNDGSKPQREPTYEVRLF